MKWIHYNYPNWTLWLDTRQSSKSQLKSECSWEWGTFFRDSKGILILKLLEAGHQVCNAAFCLGTICERILAKWNYLPYRILIHALTQNTLFHWKVCFCFFSFKSFLRSLMMELIMLLFLKEKKSNKKLRFKDWPDWSFATHSQWIVGKQVSGQHQNVCLPHVQFSERKSNSNRIGTFKV